METTGVISAGTKAYNTILFNLPVEYRPNKEAYLFLASHASGATGSVIVIKTTGDVCIYTSNSPEQFYFDGIALPLTL